MSNDGLNNKRHLDCGWLIFNKEKRFYRCCDIRSPLDRKELTMEEVMQEACSFFHFTKKTKVQKNT